MASFKVLFCISLFALFLIWSSGARLFVEFSMVKLVAEEQPKAYKFRSSTDKPSLIEQGREAIRESIERHGGYPFAMRPRPCPGRKEIRPM
ncbi:hypothetical protein ES288_D01G057100v1 [Gossypium darwinii]|uniref:Uncharacterized protein n=1 Tax=Gossypium darwinii TaxID=34276 RepID=A0A5D2DLX9_GOSDA|nr:hypothetical protein ES288_D01G057100v1 [Gossypium darwinii]